MIGFRAIAGLLLAAIAVLSADRVLLTESATAANTLSTADTWPGWRGATGSGVSSASGLPVEWSDTHNLRWKYTVRGRGNSSPAVTEHSLFVTSQDETDGSLWVTSLDVLSGELRWQRNIGTGQLVASGPPNLFEHRHNPATPSPAADEQHVVAFFGSGDLVCLGHDGRELWRKNLPDTYGAYDIKYGVASSVRLWDGRVFIASMHKGPSYVVAFDVGTGDELWLTPRNYRGLGDAPDAYSSPVILPRAGQSALLVVSGCDHVDAYDTETGERVWYSAGLMIPDEEYPRIIASPALGEGVIVASAGRGQQAIALRDDGAGDVTESARLWSTPKMTDCPSPTVHGDLCYSVRDDGLATAFDLRTGEMVWRLRLGGNRYQASPVVADGKVYFLSLEGKCTVIKAGAEAEILARNVMDGDFYATPAISRGMIFLRDRSTVYAVADAARPIQLTPVLDAVQIPESVTLAGVSGAAADAAGNIYILQRGTPPVLSFDREGRHLKSWGVDLIGSGHGLNVDPDGNVWVTDTGHHMVYKFSPDGRLLASLGKMDKPGLDDDQFNMPTFVAFGPQGQTIIADGYGNSRIMVFDSRGQLLKKWGERGTNPGEFHSPHDLAVDAAGRILVADRDNNRIQIFSLDGDLEAVWSEEGYTPFGLCIAPDGAIFIADGKSHSIHQVDDQGRIVRSWGQEGTQPGEFRTPHLITSDSGGHLYVAEVGGRRLQLMKRHRD